MAEGQPPHKQPSKRDFKRSNQPRKVSTPVKGFSLVDLRGQQSNDEDDESDTENPEDLSSIHPEHLDEHNTSDTFYSQSADETIQRSPSSTFIQLLTFNDPNMATTASVTQSDAGQNVSGSTVTATHSGVTNTTSAGTSTRTSVLDHSVDQTLQKQLSDLFLELGHDTLDIQRQRTELENLSKSRAREILQDIKQGWIAIDKLSKTSPEYYNESKRLLQSLMSKWNITLAKPTIVDEMRAISLEHKDDSKGVVGKVAHRIPPFTGTDPQYTWEMFRLKLNIVATNASYQDYEMRTIFFQSLEGNALNHFRAHESEYLTLTYPQLLEKFNKRYGITTQKVIDNLMSSPQASNEDVRSYCDKLMNIAIPLLPTAVPKKKIIQGEDGETFIQNPFYDEEMREYRNKQQQHEFYLVQFFVKGLRDEIVQRMKKLKFETLPEAMQTAIEAEEFLDAVKQMRSNNIQLSTNAVSNPLPDMDKRGSSITRSRSRERDSKPGKCHLCGRTGHWKNECPKATSRETSRYERSSRSTRFARERSNSRTRYGNSRERYSSYPTQGSYSQGSKQGSSMYQMVGDLSRKVKELSQQVGQMRFRSRSRSYSREQSRGRNRDPRYRSNRSGSRHRSSSRHRSYSRPRSYSRHRSGSRDRFRQSGYQSRSNSRSQYPSRSPSRSPSRDKTKNGMS